MNIETVVTLNERVRVRASGTEFVIETFEHDQNGTEFDPEWQNAATLPSSEAIELLSRLSDALAEKS